LTSATQGVALAPSLASGERRLLTNLDAAALSDLGWEIAELTGDYNRDGTIDAADYVVWRKYDGTRDGYNTWRAHFGQTGASAAAGASSNSNVVVPEPNSLVLLAWTIPYLIVRWCQRAMRF
jgi:hypothetical protein